MELPTSDNPVSVVEGDCLTRAVDLPADSFDAIITDPPYGLSFMGKEWDNGVPGVDFWSAFLRVVKPGGYLAAMGGTRTHHRLMVAIEDAGWEIRDCLMWLYGSGFPKGQGCLKPAWEPIVLARKPGPRVLPLGVDECRVGAPIVYKPGGWHHDHTINDDGWTGGEQDDREPLGRWPANVVHDGSDEVMEAFDAFGVRTSGKASADGHRRNQPNGFGTVGCGIYGGGKGLFIEAGPAGTLYGDSGSAARFYYCAKPSPEERGDNRHPTVKPLALMRWLVRLLCPADGLAFDPFGGSGTTAVAAALEGRRCVTIERDPVHAATASRRVADVVSPGLLAGIARWMPPASDSDSAPTARPTPSRRRRCPG